MFLWDANPIALSLGPVQIRWYGLLFAGGFLIGYFIMHKLFKKQNLNTEDLDKLLVYLFFGTIIGARLGHCLIYEPEYYLSHPIDILKVWQGGLASHGGTLGVIIALYLFIKNRSYKFLQLTDFLAIPIALVSICIRIGNFMNSEILGKYTHSDFGIVFLRIGDIEPRYPAQLFEAFAYFLIFITLILSYRFIKNRGEGFLTGLLLTLVFVARLLIEPFKEEQASYNTNFFLNVGQLLSIPFILVGIGFIIYSFKQKRL